MDPFTKENLITTKDASELSGYSSDYLARLVRGGEIIGKKIGHSWLVDTASLEIFLDTQKSLKSDRARELASSRVKEYRLRHELTERASRDLTKKIPVASKMGHPVSEIGLTHVSLRSHLLALSSAFAVVIMGANLASAEVLPNLAGRVASIAEEVSSGFNETFGDLPSHLTSKINAMHEAMQENVSRVATANIVASAQLASPLLSDPDLSSLQMALGENTDNENTRTRVATSLGGEASKLSAARGITREDVQSFADDAFHFLTSPAQVATMLTHTYVAIGYDAYALINSSLTSYRSLIEQSGERMLVLAATTRDTLAKSPRLISNMNLALGNAVIDVTHSAIQAEVTLAYSPGVVAPEIARTTVAVMNTVGDVLMRGTIATPTIAKMAYLRATGAPSRLAPALAEAVFGAEYAGASRFVALTTRVTDKYALALRSLGEAGYTSAVSTRSLADATRSFIAHAPIAIEDAYLGALGKTAVALDTITHTSPVAAVFVASAPAFSVGEKIALATYQTIHGLFDSVTSQLAFLFTPSKLAVVPTRVTPVATSSPARATTLVQQTVNSYPTYTTIVQGASQDFVNQSLLAQRNDILAKVFDMIKPLRDISNLIVRNGSFRGGNFDSGTLTNGISVAATTGTFGSLTASSANFGSLSVGTTTIQGDLNVIGNQTITGSITIGTTTVNGLLFANGIISGNSFVATSTTATSTFAGSINIDNGGFVYATSTRNVGIGVLSPAALLALQNSTSTQPIFVASNAAGTEVYRITDAGFVGIGTTTPGYALAVEGSSSLGNQAIAGYFTATTSTATSTFAGSLAVGTTSPWGNGLFTVGTSTPLLYVSSNTGNIGIGTGTPAVAFDVFSTNAIRLPVGTTGQRPLGDTGYIRYNTTTHQFEGYGDNSVWQGLGGVIDADQSTYITADTNNANEDTLRFVTANVERMTILSNGYIGIGTTTPLARFSLAGAPGAGTTLFAISTSTAGFATTTALTIDQNGNLSLLNGANLSVGGNFTVTGATAYTGLATFQNGFLSNASSTITTGLFRMDGGASTTQFTSTGSTYLATTEGNVGIGTTEPTAKLDIVASGVLGIKVTASGGTNGIQISNTDGGNGINSITAFGTAGYFSSASGYGLIVENGNVGIGAAYPLYKLDVNGTFRTVGDAFMNANTTIGGTLTQTGLATFNMGFLSNASSTITNGLFSMNGGASTTNITASGNGYFTGALSANSLTLATALTVGNGGTGVTSITGLVKGNGSSAFTAAVPSVDYVGPATTVNGHQLSSDVTVALSELGDTTVTSPVTDQILKWNGVKWINGDLVTTNAGSGVDFFYTVMSSDVPPYDSIQKTPDPAAEVNEYTVVNNSTKTIDTYLSPSGGIGSVQIDSGVWTFNTYATSSSAVGTNTLNYNVYKRTTGGTETFLFAATTTSITSATPTLIQTQVVQPAFVIDPTDRLVVKVRGTTDNVSDTTLSFIHSGNLHYSFINTPLIVRHNDLAGIQGGAAGQDYHLSLAEYTGTGTGTFVRQIAPTVTTSFNIAGAAGGSANIFSISTSTIGFATTTALTVDQYGNLSLLSGANLSVAGTGVFGGAITANAGMVSAGPISFTGTNHAGLTINNLTTAQRDLLTPASGMTIFNTTVSKMQVYNGATWKNVGNPEIGAEVTAGTAGSVLFVDASGNLAQDNANFYWDQTNRRLGLGSTTPSSSLSVQGNSYVSGTSFFGGAITATSSIAANSLTLTTPLAIASGGTGVGTFTSGQLLYGNGTNALSSVATSSATLGLGLSGSLTTIGTSQSLTIATSSLYSGAANALPYFTGTNTLGSINAGTNGYVLAMSGGTPTWLATSTIPLAGDVGGTLSATVIGAGKVTNTMLANSTIGLTSSGSLTVGTSPISLGGTSALNLNMANANTWTALQTFGNASTSQLTVTGNTYLATAGGFVGIGTTTTPSLAKLIMDGSFTNETGSGNAVAGIHQFFTFSPTVGNTVQVGNRMVLYNNPAGGTATNTAIAQIIRVIDSSNTSNLVRGLDVTANGGSNNYGVNTAIRGSAGTFGLQGFTSALAAGTSTPAAIYGENTGTTASDVLRLYSATMTNSASNFARFYQDSSAFTGTGLLMNFGAGGGSFTGNFMDLQNNSASAFKVSNIGATTIGSGSTQAGLQIGFGGLCVDNDGSCSVATAGTISAVAYATGHADLAEIYYSNESLTPGDIVYSKSSYFIGKADTKTDALILGAVSTNAGLILGQGKKPLTSQTEYAVGLSGRIPVKVTNENGPIHAGDKIVISDVAGAGMSQGKDGGTVIGIALEDFDGSLNYLSAGAVESGTATVADGAPICTTATSTANAKLSGGGDIEKSPSTNPATSSAVPGETCTQPKVTIVPQNKPAVTLSTADGTTVQEGQILVFLGLSWSPSIADTIKANPNGNVGIGTDIANARLTVSGNIFATSYEAPLSPATAWGSQASSTSVAEMPAAVLTAAGTVDLYKLATYNLSGLDALLARVDAQDVRITSLETRMNALGSGAVSSASGSPISFSTTSLASALEGFGAYISKGFAQFGTLIADKFVAATNSAGTSSAGTVTVLTGNTIAQVNNSYVLPTSKIFVTLTASMTGSWYISDKQNGSFKVVLSTQQASDVSFDYFIVQTDGQTATSTPDGIQGSTSNTNTQSQTFTSGSQTSSTAVTPIVISPTESATTTTATSTTTNTQGQTSNATTTSATSTPRTPSDTTVPVVTLNGDAAMQLTVGDTFTDLGATATDDTDGTLTAKIVKTGTVDTATAGSYSLTYSATDAAGNTGSAGRFVTVVVATAVTPAAATSTSAI